MKLIGRLYLYELLRLQPQAIPPTPIEGGFYYDDVAKQYYGCKDDLTWSIIGGKHNELLGLQGGDGSGTGERYHFTDSEHTWLVTHTTNDGSQHSYINQSVTTGASPTFVNSEFTNGPLILRDTTTPSFESNKGKVYVKSDSGDSELFYLDEYGNEVQITKDGKLTGGMDQYQGVATVSLGGSSSDFSTVADAIAAIWGTGAGDGNVNGISVGVLSESNRWAVLIYPGTYSIPVTLVGHSWIDFVGVGAAENVVLKSTNLGVMQYRSNELFKNIQFEITGSTAPNKNIVDHIDDVNHECIKFINCNFVDDGVGAPNNLLKLWRPFATWDSYTPNGTIVIDNCLFYSRGYGATNAIWVDRGSMMVGQNPGFILRNSRIDPWFANAVRLDAANTGTFIFENNTFSGQITHIMLGSNSTLYSSNNRYNAVMSSSSAAWSNTGAGNIVYSTADNILLTQSLYTGVTLRAGVTANSIYYPPNGIDGAARTLTALKLGGGAADDPTQEHHIWQISATNVGPPTDVGPILEVISNETNSSGTIKAKGTGKILIPSDIGQGISNIHYFGDSSTDGSWRIRIDGTDIVFERLESSVWVEKGTFAA